jgi:hypothetical protein
MLNSHSTPLHLLFTPCSSPVHLLFTPCSPPIIYYLFVTHLENYSNKIPFQWERNLTRKLWNLWYFFLHIRKFIHTHSNDARLSLSMDFELARVHMTVPAGSWTKLHPDRMPPPPTERIIGPCNSADSASVLIVKLLSGWTCMSVKACKDSPWSLVSLGGLDARAYARRVGW